MVVEADRTAHSSIKSALDLLEPCDNVSLILNKAMGSKSADQFGSYYAPGLRGQAAESPATSPATSSPATSKEKA
jgi:protein-tyrosine kinase